MPRCRYVAELAALVALTCVMVYAASPTDSSATNVDADWPSMQVIYQTAYSPMAGSRMQNTSTTVLIYIDKYEWSDEVVQASFTAGNPGSTREFSGGVFTQDLMGAGMIITEEIPDGKYVVPERWLSPDRMQRLESLGYQATIVDSEHVRYEYITNRACDDINPEHLADGCEAGGTATELETILARTDISTVPFPIEYRYQVDGTVTLQAAVVELVLLDDEV